jgi:hypothetical protein
MAPWTVALLAVALDASADHVDVQAELRKGRSGPEVAVTFAPRSHDIKVNQTPAPKLVLDPSQKLVSLKPTRPEKKDGYLDTTFPIVFPAEVASEARGAEAVKGTLTYYYCSKAEGWCRKGTRELEVPVTAR